MGSELIFEGKKYISASRASKIIGYNSDYIGQLCRKGLLDCRRIGRSWFVSEESLQAHKTTASLTPRGRISIYQKNLNVQNSGSSAGVATMPTVVNPLGINMPELSYRSFHQEAINFLDRKEEVRESSAFARKIVGGVLVVLLLMVFVVPNLISSTSSLSFLSQSNLGGAQISVVGNQISGSISYVKSYRSDFVGSVAYSTHIFSSIGQALDDGISAVVNGAHDRLTRLNSFIAVTGEKFGRSLFWSKQEDEREDRSGFVVVPSAGSPEANAQVKEYVTNNFSDEAEVIPDETGNSGLIKPVFKNQNDQEYLYVMVPVKEDGP